MCIHGFSITDIVSMYLSIDIAVASYDSNGFSTYIIGPLGQVCFAILYMYLEIVRRCNGEYTSFGVR